MIIILCCLIRPRLYASEQLNDMFSFMCFIICSVYVLFAVFIFLCITLCSTICL